MVAEGSVIIGLTLYLRSNTASWYMQYKSEAITLSRKKVINLPKTRIKLWQKEEDQET